MANYSNQPDFRDILNRLRTWHEELEPQLRAPQHKEAHEQAVQLKRQIEAALAALEFCQAHGLHPVRLQNAVVLPPVCSFGSEYRIMEDCDSGNCQDWIDPMMSGQCKPFSAYEGDLVV